MAPADLWHRRNFRKANELTKGQTSLCLGRTAFVLLANNSDSQDDWKGNDALWHVAKKATNADKQLRYPSVQEFVSAWHAAITND